MLQWFEKLVDPYPTRGLNEPLPSSFCIYLEIDTRRTSFSIYFNFVYRRCRNF